MSGYWLISYPFLWALVLVLAILALAILRQLGLIYARLGGSLGALQTDEGIALGERLPVVEVAGGGGTSHSLVPEASHYRLLLFVSPTCDLCGPMAPQLPPFIHATRSEAEFLLILTKPDRDGVITGVRGMPPALLEPNLPDLLRLPGLPYALLVDRDGVVVSEGLVNDVVQLRSLLNDVTSLSPKPAPS